MTCATSPAITRYHPAAYAARLAEISTSTNGLSLIQWRREILRGAAWFGTMRRITRSRRQMRRHRLCAAVTLFAYLVACLGLPIPAAAAPRDAGQPFPCQDHPCGCRTAEQCWMQCCCFTPEQRFSWAREHNVQPPSYAEQPTGNGWNSPRQRDLDKKPCCSSHGQTQKPEITCCSNHQQPSCEEWSQEQQPCDQSPAKPKKTGWVLGMMALQCQGHSTLWAGAGLVLPPPPPLTWNPWPNLVDQVFLIDEFAVSFSANPPEPPPRPLA